MITVEHMGASETSHKTTMRIRLDHALICPFLFASFLVETGLAREQDTLRNVFIAVALSMGAIYVVVCALQDAQHMNVSLLIVPIPLALYLVSFVFVNSMTTNLADNAFAIVAMVFSAIVSFFWIPQTFIRDKSRFFFTLQILEILALLAMAFAILGMMGVHSFLGFPLLAKDVYLRYGGFSAASGIMEHPLVFGMFMTMAAISAFYLYRLTKSYWHLALCILAFVFIFLSQARGSVLAAAFAAAICFSPRFVISRRINFIACLLLLPLIAGLAYFVITLIPALSNFFRLNMGLSGREVIWGVGAFMILRNPWLGYGYGTAGKFTESISATLLKLGFPVPGAAFHNTYLTYMFEAGVIAAAFYFLLYLIPLWSVSGAKMETTDKRHLLASTVSILVLNFWIDNNIGGLRITSVVIGLYLGYAYLRAQNSTRATE